MTLSFSTNIFSCFRVELQVASGGVRHAAEFVRCNISEHVVFILIGQTFPVEGVLNSGEGSTSGVDKQEGVSTVGVTHLVILLMDVEVHVFVDIVSSFTEVSHIASAWVDVLKVFEGIDTAEGEEANEVLSVINRFIRLNRREGSNSFQFLVNGAPRLGEVREHRNGILDEVGLGNSGSKCADK